MEEPAQVADSAPKARRRRQRHAAEQDDSFAGLSSPEASSSKLPLPASGPKAAAQTDASRCRPRKRPARTKVESHWECVSIADREVSRIPPVWSKDGRFYFTTSHTSIHIHSSTPPAYQRLSTLSGDGPDAHQKPITALLLHPSNPMQLITAALDGQVKIWNWVEGRLVRSINLAPTGSVTHLCLGQVADKWQIFGTVSQGEGRGDKKQWKIVRTVLTVPPKYAQTVTTIGKLAREPAAIFISPRSTYLVTLAANKAYTYRLPTVVFDAGWHKLPSVKFVSDQIFTCGAFAPQRIASTGEDDEWFATGDVAGVIRLWHGLTAAFRQRDIEAGVVSGVNAESDEKRLPTTSLHWHAHAVGALAFTPSGAQLLSAGEESVLVQWHLASGKREYIPRLGGKPVVSLAVKQGARGVEEEWWMKFTDGGAVKVGASSGHVTSIGQAARIDPMRPNQARPYPFAVHPSSQSIVLPSSHSSTLQFIDPQSSSVLFDLEVAPSNRVSKRADKDLQPVAVEHVAFTDATEGGNQWMATVEGRSSDEDEGGGLVKTLKIWQWMGQKYAVTTQFPRPHGINDITKAVFSPSIADAGSSSLANQSHLLTTSIDGTAKIWHVRQARRVDQGKSNAKKAAVYDQYWSTRSTFSYRSMPIYDAAFSPDSTIIALAHGSVITLWDVESNILLKTLDGGIDDIRQLGFVGPDGRHLAGIGHGHGLAVWDLLSCELTYAISEGSYRQLHTSTRSFFVAVESTSRSRPNSVVSVFSPESTKPIRTVTLDSAVANSCLLPSATAKFTNLQFAGVQSDGTVSRFGDAITRAAITGANRLTSRNDKQTSIWQEMFGKDAFLEIEDAPMEVPVEVVRASSGRPSQVFEGPSHTLPPVSLLFDSFLQQILVPISTADLPAEVIEEKIEYGQAPEPQAAPAPKVDARAVSDASVKELEVFFRGLLSTPIKTPKKTTVNGHASTNGKTTLPNGDARDVAEVVIDVAMDDASNKTPKSGKKATPKKTPVAATDDESDEDEAATTPSQGKGRGKKRKAPKDKS